MWRTRTGRKEREGGEEGERAWKGGEEKEERAGVVGREFSARCAFRARCRCASGSCRERLSLPRSLIPITFALIATSFAVPTAHTYSPVLSLPSPLYECF